MQSYPDIKAENDSEYYEAAQEVSHIEHLRPIVLPKSVLIRLAEKSENFNDLVKNCFVRMQTKTEKMTFFTLYRIVGTIDTCTPTGKSSYSKRIKVDNCNERILESVDENAIKQEEFDMWLANVHLKNQPLPTIQWIHKKRAGIDEELKDAIKKSEISTHGDLLRITLKRNELVQLIMNGGEQLAKGCYVRMVLSRTGGLKYGIAQIIDIVGAEPYIVNLLVKETICEFTLCKFLDLRYMWKAYNDIGLMSVSSNSFDEEEFDIWSKAVIKAKVKLPTYGFVEQKQRDLEEFLSKHKIVLPKREVDVKRESGYKRSFAACSRETVPVPRALSEQPTQVMVKQENTTDDDDEPALKKTKK